MCYENYAMHIKIISEYVHKQDWTFFFFWQSCKYSTSIYQLQKFRWKILRIYALFWLGIVNLDVKYLLWKGILHAVTNWKFISLHPIGCDIGRWPSGAPKCKRRGDDQPYGPGPLCMEAGSRRWPLTSRWQRRIHPNHQGRRQTSPVGHRRRSNPCRCPWCSVRPGRASPNPPSARELPNH